MLSGDPELGADLTELFNHLTGYSRPGEYRRLLVAPMHLRDALRCADPRAGARRRRDHDEDERARRPRDSSTSSTPRRDAGARVDLIVRGICCLRAGVPGLSDSITVRSIVGRFLEHSRIFRFGAPGDDDTEYVIGSADMMPRNLDRRVEAMLRVTDRRMRARLDEILDINFADDVLAWTLEPDGTWRKVPTVDGHRIASAIPRARASRAPRCAASKADPCRSSHLRDRRRSFGRRSPGRTIGCSTHEAGFAPDDDPEAVHQARVATRRLRSDLRTFEHFARSHAGRPSCARELRWLGAELGAVRDIEVLRDRLARARGRAPDHGGRRGAACVRRLDADRDGAADRSARVAAHRALRAAARRRSAKRPRHPTFARRRALQAATQLSSIAVRPLEEAAARGRTARRRTLRRRVARGAHARQAVPLRSRSMRAR